MLSANDLKTLEENGLPALITSLSARISRANDLLDTAFLTAQTDIYRFRQNVLGSTAASTLATSPVLANIATGETAAATSTNLQTYINTLVPPPTSTTTVNAATGATTTTSTVTSAPVLQAPVFNPIRYGVTPIKLLNFSATPAAPVQAIRSSAVKAKLSLVGTGVINVFHGPVSPVVTSPPVRLSPVNFAGVQSAASGVTTSAFSQSGAGIAQRFGDTAVNLPHAAALAGPAQIVFPGQTAPATPSDITSQSPIAGAQLNIRTLTIAERLQQSPSQEAMFYAIGNRLSFLQTLATLQTDLNLVADDLTILVDALPPAASTSDSTAAPVPAAVPVETHYFSEWLDPNIRPTLLNKIQSPYLVTDASEATLFSVGVRVVEQHTMLLRALEARVQLYSDFVALCTNALNSIQGDIQQAQVYITQLQNTLNQDRQNVAFTTALLGDEKLRVQGVNAQRMQILQSSVQLIAYTRARTLEVIVTPLLADS